MRGSVCVRGVCVCEGGVCVKGECVCEGRVVCEEGGSIVISFQLCCGDHDNKLLVTIATYIDHDNLLSTRV